MKRLFALLLVGMLSLALSVPALAYSFYDLTYDATDLIDEDYMEELGTETFRDLTDRYQFEVRMDVVDDTQGYDVDEYAQIFYDEFDYGYEGTGDGAVLLLYMSSMNNNLNLIDYSVCVGGVSYDTDAMTRTLKEAVSPYLKPTNFAGLMSKDMDYLKKAVDAYTSTLEAELSGMAPAGDRDLVLDPSTDADPQPGAASSAVMDEAGLLSESAIAQLNQISQRIASQYGCGVYVATVEDMADYGYSNIESFSEYWYQHENLGLGSEKTGILLMLSMEDRDFDLDAFGAQAHYSFTDYGKEALADTFLDNFRNNDWEGGFIDYMNGVDYLLGEAAKGEPVDIMIEDPVETPKSIFTGVGTILGVIIGFITCGINKSKMRTAVKATDADDYVIENTIRLNTKWDRFTHSTVQRIAKQQSSSGSSRGHSGGTTISSSGHSHHSGKF